MSPSTDAVNASTRRSRPYAFDAQAEGGVYPDAAVAAAARTGAVCSLLNRPRALTPKPPSMRALLSVEAAETAALAAIPAGEAKAQGIVVGRSAPAPSAILDLRAGYGVVWAVSDVLGARRNTDSWEYQCMLGVRC